ncbi:MAG: hypothetical protein COV74_05765, partial [Candidatus Omnitrophica bacterium CG11_big_fil_rev_8_21_14_0_20_45_26]
MEKNELQNGDILLCTGTDLIARLIRWGTGSDYSHVAVVASAKLGLIIEAVPKGGVRAIHIDNYKTSYVIFRVLDPSKVNIIGVVGYLLQMLARAYDFKSVIKLGWKMFLRKIRLIKLLGLKVSGQKQSANGLQKQEDYFCSELCYKAFYFGGGLDIVPNVEDGETTSPADIANSPLIKRVHSIDRLVKF